MTIIEQTTLLHYHRHQMSLYGPGTTRPWGGRKKQASKTFCSYADRPCSGSSWAEHAGGLSR